jgi:hypothetical protein
MHYLSGLTEHNSPALLKSLETDNNRVLDTEREFSKVPKFFHHDLTKLIT